MELNRKNLKEYYNGGEYFSIPDIFTSLGDYCFYRCYCFYSLKRIIIPNSIISIGHSCFYSCLSLKEIIIPDESSMELLKELIN